MNAETLWIFGYGSLVWRPAFPHLQRRLASIEGYTRRFWQGSIDHRGTPARPGRVVTLLPDDHPALEQERTLDSDDDGDTNRPAPSVEPCWGMAYEVPIEDPAGVLARLDHRERGGYERREKIISLFEAYDGAAAPNPTSQPEQVPGVVYVASPENAQFLGAAPLATLADEIAQAVGPSGENPEYVFELAESLRALGVGDRHVFEVEAAVARIVSGPPSLANQGRAK